MNNDVKAFQGANLHSLKAEFNAGRKAWMTKNMENEGLTFEEVKDIFPEEFKSFDHYRVANETKLLEKTLDIAKKAVAEHEKALKRKKKAVKREDIEIDPEAVMKQNEKEEGKKKEIDSLATEVDPDDFPVLEDSAKPMADKKGGSKK